MRYSAAFLAAFLSWAGSAAAVESVLKQIPDAKVVGQGKLSLVFWDIYDATLYAPNGKLSPSKSFALSIRYKQEIDGRDIADRSVQEIRKQGYHDEIRLAAWNSQLKMIFPNVKDGSVLSALFFPGDKTVFYSGDKQIGVIADAEFGRLFSDIWIGPQTSEPQLRRKLLGLP